MCLNILNLYRQLEALRKAFSELDIDGGGTIGLDELMLPLLGLGLCSTPDEVEEIFNLVDDDKSGEIDF